jgi:hypothetical protein
MLSYSDMCFVYLPDFLSWQYTTSFVGNVLNQRRARTIFFVVKNARSSIPTTRMWIVHAVLNVEL